MSAYAAVIPCLSITGAQNASVGAIFVKATATEYQYLQVKKIKVNSVIHATVTGVAIKYALWRITDIAIGGGANVTLAPKDTKYKATTALPAFLNAMTLATVTETNGWVFSEFRQNPEEVTTTTDTSYVEDYSADPIFLRAGQGLSVKQITTSVVPITSVMFDVIVFGE